MDDQAPLRPSWDETWMDQAHVIAGRSLCGRSRVGMVIVDLANRPVSMGYNGPPGPLQVNQGTNCKAWCPRGSRGTSMGSVGPSYQDCVSVHAEVNAILFADRRTYEGGTVYITKTPCWECAKMIANSGVARVVVPLEAHGKRASSLELLRACRIVVKEVTTNEDSND